MGIQFCQSVFNVWVGPRLSCYFPNGHEYLLVELNVIPQDGPWTKTC